MRDQAADLRNLVVRAALENQAPLVPPPRLVAFSGGEHGAGVTNLAFNVARALTDQGCRVVLVDSDSHRPDIARWCRASTSTTIQHVLGGTHTLHEVIQPGPEGLQIVPGCIRPSSASVGDREMRRLIREFQSLGRHADAILVDLGAENQLAGEFWEVADDVVVVTTPDASSVMSSYSLIKTNYSIELDTRIHIVVNRADDRSMAVDVHRRINQSCERFRQHSVEMLGWLAEVPGSSLDAVGVPLNYESNSAFAVAVQGIALKLLNWHGGSAGVRAAA